MPKSINGVREGSSGIFPHVSFNNNNTGDSLLLVSETIWPIPFYYLSNSPLYIYPFHWPTDESLSVSRQAWLVRSITTP